jgi:hypothetical protein
MQRLATNDRRKRLTASAGAGAPCVSLYLPLGLTEEERQGARQRLQSLLRQAQETLMRHYPAVASALAKSLVALADRLPQGVPGRGVAIFLSQGVAGYLPLPERPRELAVVSESFHVKPLLSLLQGHERFFVLSLEPRTAVLYEGSGVSLDEREVFQRALGRGDEARELARFCRDVEQRLRSRFRGRYEPLMVVAPAKLRALYRGLSRLRNHIDHPSLSLEADAVSASELHALTWPLATDHLMRQRRRLSRDYRIARLKRATVERLDDVAVAVFEGRVATLLIERHVQIWGRFDEMGRRIELARRRGAAPVDCLLDDLAERVVGAGGNVYVLETADMPVGSPVAAILRRKP